MLFAAESLASTSELQPILWFWVFVSEWSSVALQICLSAHHVNMYLCYALSCLQRVAMYKAADEQLI